MSYKVKLKLLNNSIITFNDICVILRKFSIKCHNYKQIHNGFIVFVNDNSDYDKFFAESVSNQLKETGIQIIESPDVIAKKTAYVKCPTSVCEKPFASIKHEIEQKNSWCKINNIFVLRNSIKILFNNIDMCVKAQTKGLLIFNLSIPPYNITAEKYAFVQQCFICYKLDNHSTRNCDKSHDFLICSVCASPGHTFRNCQNNTKKCLNCNGNHVAISLGCKSRRDIINIKLNTATVGISYAQAASSSPPVIKHGRNTTETPNYNATTPQIDETTSMKIETCVKIAIHASEDKSNIPALLNSLLIDNNLPEIKIGGKSLSMIKSIKKAKTTSINTDLATSNIVDYMTASSLEYPKALSTPTTANNLTNKSPVTAHLVSGNINPDGRTVILEENNVTPDGSDITPDGSDVTPDGSDVTPDGSDAIPDGSTRTISPNVIKNTETNNSSPKNISNRPRRSLNNITSRSKLASTSYDIRNTRGRKKIN